MQYALYYIYLPSSSWNFIAKFFMLGGIQIQIFSKINA